MKRFLSILIALLFFPLCVNAKVIVTEIAWMGTAESQYSEWIELYNDSNQSVDLAGWKLYEASGDTTIFTFSKSISAHGLLLLERTTTSAPDAVPGSNDESGTFGGSGLSNSGEFLVLKDNSGNIEQSLDFSAGWPAGESDTKKTMQWNGSQWVSATATPKILNDGITISEDDPIDDNADSSEDDPDDTTDSSNTLPPKKKTGGGAFDTLPKTIPHVEFVIPKVVYAGISYDFNAKVFLEYGVVDRGIFVWNMGDGTTIRQTYLIPINHNYKYLGKYTLSLAYYRNDYDTKPYILDSVVFDVVEPTIEISTFDNGNAIKIKNPTDKKLDLSNWRISIGNSYGVFPDMTTIAPKATIIIPVATFGMTNISNGDLVTPNGQIIASFGKNDYKIVRSSTAYTNLAPLIKASAIEKEDSIVYAEEKSPIKNNQKQNHTKYIIFGVVSLITIGLAILLERFMVQQE
jgi:hypothetical protein